MRHDSQYRAPIPTWPRRWARLFRDVPRAATRSACVSWVAARGGPWGAAHVEHAREAPLRTWAREKPRIRKSRSNRSRAGLPTPERPPRSASGTAPRAAGAAAIPARRACGRSAVTASRPRLRPCAPRRSRLRRPGGRRGRCTWIFHHRGDPNVTWAHPLVSFAMPACPVHRAGLRCFGSTHVGAGDEATRALDPRLRC